MSHVNQALARFQKQIGVEEGPSEWHTVTQGQINDFADTTYDHQFIHVDVERAKKETPFGGTIAHGFLTLSMLPHLQEKLTPADPAVYEGLAMGINYGLDKVRFPNPVRVESRIRARRELVSADEVAPNTLQLKQKVTIEIDGEAKPACVAEALTRLIYS